MQFSFNIYSSLLLIFFVHGLVYAILLLRKGMVNETPAEKWLATFLLLCIMHIAPWMLGFAGWYDKQPYRQIMFYIPFQNLLFLGPVIYFYIQSLLNPAFRFGKQQWLHLVPGILYLLYNVVMVVADKLVLANIYFYADGRDKDFDNWYQYLGFFSMLFYFIISLKYYTMYRKLMVQVISYADVTLFKWIRNFLVAFLTMLVVKLLFTLASNIPAFQHLDYVGPWWEYLTFAIIFYYIAITGMSNAIHTKVSFRLNALGNNTVLLLQNVNTITKTTVEDAEVIVIENDTKITYKNDENLLAEWKPKIIAFVQHAKAYEDAELSLTQVARALQTNPSIISKVINQGFQLNFNDFINKYRIEAVKEKLAAGEQKKQTLLGIAYDCGFNSKATFNRAFKKFTNVAPKDWVA